MNLRMLRPEDFKELAILFHQSIRRISAKDYSDEQIKAWAPDEWDLKEWALSFNNKIVFIAEKDHKVAGFGELEKDGHIDRFYIHPDYAGIGVGKFIYQGLEAEAKKMNISSLFVEASITAKPFFEKMGFAVILEQTVYRKKVAFINYKMTKIFQIPATDTP